MASKPTSAKQKFAQQDEDIFLNFTDIFGLCISNWKWFVVSITIAVSAAMLYLRITPPIYTRVTSIVVKDDNSNKAVESIFSSMQNGRTASSTSLNNEMIAFRKSALMSKVVERLNLDYEYSIQGRLRNTVLYGSSQPISVVVNGKGSESVFEFRIHIDDDSHATVKFVNSLGKERRIQGPIGKPFRTSIGMVTISKTPSFANRSGDDITVRHIGVAGATGMFLSHLNVANTNQESTVIDLSITDENPERADAVLNTLIAVYNDNWVTNRNQVIVATNRFIGERLVAIEEELGDVEDEMTNYKQANHTLDLMSEGGKYMSRSMEFDNKNLSYENELTLTKYFRDYMSKVRDNAQTLPLSAGISNEALSSQVTQYNELVLNRSNLVASSTESNPLVTDIDKQLAVLRNGIIITIDNHIGNLQTQVRLLTANDKRNNELIEATPGKQKMYVDIERRRKIKEQLYTFLLQTREQNELQQAFAAYNTRVLQPSSGSNVQSFPDVNKVWFVALAIALGLPMAILVIREWSNTRVRGRRDIEKLTIPFVGELPNVDFPDEVESTFAKFWKKLAALFKRKKKHRHGKHGSQKVHRPARVVVRPGSRNVINEAFRVLRTNVEFIIGQNSDTKVIMTTSANPGSGKTFISYNLAYCMSLKGKRVIALDVDLRRRSLSGFVGKPDKGISDYINGSVEDWHDLLIKPTENNEFYILPVGTIPPNPAEIISYDRFGELIAEIRKEFDYVFFDCPPVEVVADTSILAKYADITLFVIRAGLMQLEFLAVLEDYYTEKKYNNMGIILNGTLTASSRYGYRRYGYRYGYGYGYGYGGYGYGNGYSEGYSKGEE